MLCLMVAFTIKGKTINLKRKHFFHTLFGIQFWTFFINQIYLVFKIHIIFNNQKYSVFGHLPIRAHTDLQSSVEPRTRHSALSPQGPGSQGLNSFPPISGGTGTQPWMVLMLSV